MDVMKETLSHIVELASSFDEIPRLSKDCSSFDK